MAVNGVRVSVKHKGGCSTLLSSSKNGRRPSIWSLRQLSMTSGGVILRTAHKFFNVTRSPAHWVDLGSGGGFSRHHYRDSPLRTARKGTSIWWKAIRKRRRFCGFALGSVKPAVRFMPSRIEEAPKVIPHCDVIWHEPSRSWMCCSTTRRRGWSAMKIYVCCCAKAGITSARSRKPVVVGNSIW